MLKYVTAMVRLGSYFVEKAKRKHGHSFLPLRMLKQSTAGVLFH